MSIALTDTERAAGLRRMKTVATGLLAIMAVIFLIAFALQEQYPWLQYVRAAAEGGMTSLDPVEYAVEGVGQTQVSPKVGLTFAAGLRSSPGT